MTTVTFLGASGGVGTTTLAALSLHLLAAGSMPVPAVIAEDTTAFDQRSAIRQGSIPGHELVDGGRYDESKAAAALGRGYLVLVGAQSVHGVKTLELRLADVATRFGSGGQMRSVPVITSAFGRRRTSSHDVPVQMRLPYDRALAAGGSLSVALPRLGARTRSTLAQRWTPWLREAYASR